VNAIWSSVCHRFSALTVVGVSAVALALVGAPAAGAAPCGFEIFNIGHGPEYDNYGHGPTWSIVGEPGETLKFDHSLAYTNTWSANVTLSASVVSASLGFSVGKTETTTTGASFTVPQDGAGRWALQAGTIDQTVTFHVKDSCSGKEVGLGSATKTGPITTRHFKLAPDSTVADGRGGGGQPKAHL
jgi:hypothetical protein